MLHATWVERRRLKASSARGYIANRTRPPGVYSILDDDTAEDGSALGDGALGRRQNRSKKPANAATVCLPTDVIPIGDTGVLAMCCAGGASDAGLLSCIEIMSRAIFSSRALAK